MHIQIKQLIFYISYFIPELIATLTHELSHYIVAVILYPINDTEFPKLVFTQIAKYKFNADNSTSTYSFRAHVTYNGYVTYTSFVILKLIVVAPAITTIALFIFMPWYVCLFMLPLLNSLWLSLSDVDQLKMSYTEYSTPINIKTKNTQSIKDII